MYIQLIELENDDLNHRAIIADRVYDQLIIEKDNLFSEATRLKSLIYILEINNKNLEADNKYIAKQRDTISDNVHSYYQGLRKEIDLKSRLTPITNQGLLDKNQFLANENRRLREEINRLIKIIT